MDLLKEVHYMIFNIYELLFSVVHIKLFFIKPVVNLYWKTKCHDSIMMNDISDNMLRGGATRQGGDPVV